jgi:hypothetical protein
MVVINITPGSGLFGGGSAVVLTRKADGPG